VYSNRQSEGSVVLYCCRFMSSISPVKSADIHVPGSQRWVICCNYISATFFIFLCTLCMTAMCVIQVNTDVWSKRCQISTLWNLPGF